MTFLVEVVSGQGSRVLTQFRVNFVVKMEIHVKQLATILFETCTPFYDVINLIDFSNSVTILVRLATLT